MNLTKSTRYALYATMEMAGAGDQPVTVGQVSRRYRIPEGALAKVFQQLVRSGLAVGTRGVGGGYRLAKPPSLVTVLDVIKVYESPHVQDQCLLDDRGGKPCSDFPSCRLRRLFDEVDEVSRCTLQSVSLETLVVATPHLSRAGRQSQG
jgi:Rrf2 family protein